MRALESASEPEVVLDGRRVLCLASNNYLGLAAHPEVIDAAAEAARTLRRRAPDRPGSITGGLVLHDELEARLAAFKGTEAALLFSSGYLANLGTVAALVGPGDAVFSDELNHASIIDGCRLSRAEVHVYRHADAEHLERACSAAWRRAAGAAARALVVTDSVFSMDGDIAPLPDIVDACERHGAILMVDEAHATGVVGPGGRGAVAGYGLEGRVGVVMGTLSKSLGRGRRIHRRVGRPRAPSFATGPGRSSSTPPSRHPRPPPPSPPCDDRGTGTRPAGPGPPPGHPPRHRPAIRRL